MLLITLSLFITQKAVSSVEGAASSEGSISPRLSMSGSEDRLLFLYKLATEHEHDDLKYEDERDRDDEEEEDDNEREDF